MTSDCDQNGTCKCKEGVAGEKCSTCKSNHYGFPNCQGKMSISLN